MSAFDDVAWIVPRKVWDGITVRAVHGERLTLGVVELAPGAFGRRHIDPIQEEVFVVLAGTLTIHLGEGDEPEMHELPKGSVVVVQPGTALQLSNRHDDELRLFIVGAPPERGEATFLPTIE